LCLIAASVATSTSGAAAPAEIRILGERVFPESLTSSADGTIYVGSVVAGSIFRAMPGSGSASPWIKPGTAGGLHSIFGVFVDSGSRTLWVCSNELDPSGRALPSHGTLFAFNSKTGANKGHYELPTADAFCNDIAVAGDGTVYATDTSNMQMVRLRPGDKQLAVWSPDDAFGPKGGALDGIAIVGKEVWANTLNTGKLFRVAIGIDGKAGAVAEINLDRKIDHPDGMRSFGKNGVLIVESGGPGRLSTIILSGGAGHVSTLKEDFPDGAVAVTVVGATAYVLESQFMALRPAGTSVLNPFHATAVKLAKPWLLGSQTETPRRR
jgi:sugar lactone lactonase YvrE